MFNHLSVPCPLKLFRPIKKFFFTMREKRINLLLPIARRSTGECWIGSSPDSVSSLLLPSQFPSDLIKFARPYSGGTVLALNQLFCYAFLHLFPNMYLYGFIIACWLFGVKQISFYFYNKNRQIQIHCIYALNSYRLTIKL